MTETKREWHKAIKVHQCMGCQRKIRAGIRYVRWRSYHEDPHTVKMHSHCVDVFDELAGEFDFSNEDGAPYELEALAESVGRRYCVDCETLECPCETCHGIEDFEDRDDGAGHYTVPVVCQDCKE